MNIFGQKSLIPVLQKFAKGVSSVVCKFVFHPSLIPLHLLKSIFKTSSTINLFSGQLLVEHEPTKYELVSFKPDRLRSIRNSEVTLDEALRIPKSGLLNYTHWNELYFGRGHNIPTGSAVTLVYTNGTKVRFQWGIVKKMSERTQMRLGGRSELARVIATKVERQWDYFATLSS